MLLQSVSFRTKEDKHRQKEDKKSIKEKGKCSFRFSASLLNFGLEFNNILTMMKAMVKTAYSFFGHAWPRASLKAWDVSGHPIRDKRPLLLTAVLPEEVTFVSQNRMKPLLISLSLCGLGIPLPAADYFRTSL